MRVGVRQRIKSVLWDKVSLSVILSPCVLSCSSTGGIGPARHPVSSGTPRRKRRRRSDNRKTPGRDSSSSDSTEQRPRHRRRDNSGHSHRRTAYRRKHRRATTDTLRRARDRDTPRPDPITVFSSLPVVSRQPPPPRRPASACRRSRDRPSGERRAVPNTIRK